MSGRDPDPASAADANARLWNRSFVVLLAAQIGVAWANSSFLILPKFLATRLAAGPEAIGKVVLISSLALVVSLLPAGSMVDRHGRKRFLTAGAALMGLACGAHVLVDSIGPLLYGLRVLQALAFAFAYAAGAALAIDAAPPARLGQALGLFGLVYVMTGALAPASVEAIVAVAGWGPAFLLAGAAALGSGLLSLSVAEARSESVAATHVATKTILARPAVRRAMAVVGLLGVGYGGAFNFHQPFALSLGITELRDFFLAHSLAAGASRLALGPFVDRIGLRRISLASLALYALAVLAIAWLDHIGLLLLGLGIGVSHGLFYPAFTGVVVEGCAPAERGRYIALLQAGLYVGIGLGGVALGAIAARFGYPAIFVIGAAMLVVAWLLIASERPRAVPGPGLRAPARP
ncbi:MAG: MFS transporter [Myxococcota bacterium]